MFAKLLPHLFHLLPYKGLILGPAELKSELIEQRVVKGEGGDLDPESARLVAVLSDVLLDSFKFFVEYSLLLLLRHVGEFFVGEPIFFEILELLLMLGPLPHQLEYDLDLAETVVHNQATREDFKKEHAQVIGFNTFIMKVYSLEWLIKSKFDHEDFESVKSLLVHYGHLGII